MSRIIVGMSGGVDSSVVAQILKNEGHEVIGLFMKNWEEIDSNGVCPAEVDYNDVISVCEKIGINYYSVNFAKEYQENVFQEFLSDYRNGFTPNPDVLCNREIKFKVFYQKAMEFNADFLATGHYCQKAKLGDSYYLLKGKDDNKDQSYFLNSIESDVLAKVLFPIGHLDKHEVRAIAKKYDLATKNKKDSTGICFIGERNFRPFLKKYIKETKGEFRTLDDNVVGHHDGHPFYTIGQRKGLGLGGAGKPWFVIKKDISNNIIYVERGDDHLELYSNYLIAKDFHLINKNFKITYPYKCKAKIRYRQKDVECTIFNDSKDSKDSKQIRVEFVVAQRAVAIGQYIVFYSGLGNQMDDEINADLCIGGARIIAIAN